MAEALYFLPGLGTGTQTDTDSCPDVADILAGKTDQGPGKGHRLSVVNAMARK